jgi:hypothetical protein
MSLESMGFHRAISRWEKYRELKAVDRVTGRLPYKYHRGLRSYWHWSNRFESLKDTMKWKAQAKHARVYTRTKEPNLAEFRKIALRSPRQIRNESDDFVWLIKGGQCLRRKYNPDNERD